MNSPLDELKFHLQIIEDSRRIVMCSPDDQLACEVATAGYPLVTVQVHPWMRKGTVYILDPNVVEASFRAGVQRSPSPGMYGSL